MSRSVRRLTETALMLAVATVLSLIKLVHLPFGGSITLFSMLPLCVLSVRRGVKWGLSGGIVYACIKLMLNLGEIISWGLTPAALAGCMVFDYLIAFTVIGLAGCLRTHGRAGILAGTAIALFLRFCSHLLSGVLIFDAWTPDGWANPFVYSVVYNGGFMLPELLMVLAALFVLTKTAAFREILDNADE